MTQPNDNGVKKTVHSTAHNGVDGDNATVVDDNVGGDGNSVIRNSDSNSDGASHNLDAQLRRNISARYRQERRFRRAAASAILIGVAFLLWLITVSLLQAVGALWQTHIALDIDFKQEYFAPTSDASSHLSSDSSNNLSSDSTSNVTSNVASDAATADLTARIEQVPFARMIKESLRNDFPEVRTRKQKRELYRLVSSGAEFDLRDEVLQRRELIGQTARVWLLAGGDVDLVTKGVIDRNLPEDNRRVSDKMIAHIDALRAQGRIEKRFNTQFFTAGDSRNAEQAGILGALLGSILTLLVTMLLALPVGVCAAVYLQEFAPRNKWIDWVEVNINNLAAVPSITFGLLGLAVLINFVGLPRSVPLVGGMVLALMTLPTVIISSRAALAAVPPRIRQAALGVGASKMQSVLHHVVPLALPGMLTGAIIGLAQALGETAPLLAIGMVAFIVDIPSGFTDPSTALPVQIYLWADSPERGFVERTSLAIVVLLCALGAINGAVAWVRAKTEKRW